MKRVLVLNQYFPPDTAATAKMIAALVKFLSHYFHVTVLAGRPSYNPTERHPFYLWRQEKYGSVTVERVGSTTLPRHRMRWRLSNYLSYLALTLPRALVIPTDVVIAMSDPPLVCLIGVIVAAVRKCPLIYNIRDLHPDMAIAAGLIPPCPLTKWWEKLHRWAMKRANWIVVLGEDMKERVEAKGIPAEKIIIIRDGVPIPSDLPPSDHPLVRQLRCGFNFVAMHAGNIGFYGAWETLILAAQKLKDDNFGLIFIGEGAFKGKLIQLANSASNVHFLPLRPKEEVLFVLVSPDIHIVTIKRDMEGLVVPSKLYPILAAGKPVLVVASERSDAARIVTQTKCGLVADPDSPNSVVDAFKWAQHNKSTLQKMGQRAREIVSEFSEENQFQKFVDLLFQVTAEA